MFKKFFRLGWLSLLLLQFPVQSDELEVGEEGKYIPLVDGKDYVHVVHEGRSVKVVRVQDPDYELKGYFAKTIRPCPPFCIGAMEVDPQVDTVAEVEVFNFMEGELRDGTGVLIDARTPEWFQRGTIPGSVNFPFTTLTKDEDDPGMVEILQGFGAKRRVNVGVVERKLEEFGLLDGELKSDKWDFSDARKLMLWCNGPACGQSPRAIQGLLAVGYPPSKLKYYRGGMQLWQLWGLTTVVPGG